MKYIEVKGKNIEDAISIGLKELGTTRDKVEVEILKEQKSGIFGLFGNKSVAIKIILKDQSFDYNEILASIEKNIKRMFDFANLHLSSKIEIKDNKICLDIYGVDAHLLIGKSGDVLEAFETILSLMINKEQKTKVNLEVDIDGYRKGKLEKIAGLTRTVAEKVLETGEDYKMKNMRSSERKVVHSVIEEFPELYSFSLGYGSSRYIIITKNKPKNGGIS